MAMIDDGVEGGHVRAGDNNIVIWMAANISEALGRVEVIEADGATGADDFDLIVSHVG